MEFKDTRKRHFRLGSTQIAAIGLAKEELERGKTCYCISDSRTAHRAFNRADIPFWDSISFTATLFDDSILKFGEGERLIKALSEAGADIPKNYTSLLKEEAATFPV
ncbi:hypothetical protein [Halobacterium wangiae]|uniref:hypothetical protein n=1 Tax=Halobacterium wangiae TaxID=2902623 RepID=UPI001E5A448D|nr:hypothetical protein [Halobacterium wangiae]